MDARRIALSLIAVAAAACGGRARAASNCPRAELPAYAHNDYENAHPLYDALSLGYQGTEADVFLVGGELLLGHERRVAAEDGNFESLYLAPLRAVVARCGHFTADGEPFLLTVELKEKSRPTFDTLVALLGRYRDLLSSTDEDGTTPAVQVVLVGWYPAGFVDSITIPLSRQARLERADRPPADAVNRDVGLIGVDYNETIGRRWQLPAQRRRWLSAIRQTKAAFPGLRIRAYHVPIDQRLYDELLDAGVDLIGTGDLVKTARLFQRRVVRGGGKEDRIWWAKGANGVGSRQCRRARGAEEREVPDSARCRTARKAQRRTADHGKGAPGTGAPANCATANFATANCAPANDGFLRPSS